MRIETKFNLGDSVFVLYENKIYNVVVTRIDVTIGDARPVRNYRIKFPSGGKTMIAEDRLFTTKQKLVDSL